MLAGSAARASTWIEYKDPAGEGANYLSATYFLQLPDASTEVKGVVVVVPATNQPARTLAEQGGWPGYARGLGYAVLACEFQGDERRDYSNARRGSGQSLLRALRAFSDQTGQRNLLNANMLVYGVSSGAQFATSLAQDKPDRVYAFVAVLGAYWQPANAGGRKTPGLFVSATNQGDAAAQRTADYVVSARAYGAYWAHLTLPQERSAVPQSLALAQSYLTQAVKLRQSPDKSPTGSPEGLKPIDGFAVDPATGTLVSASELGRSQTASTFWFPAQSTAENWLALDRSRRIR
jgi:poly(3-hydroxybutyrate) depolymerase